LDGYPEEGEHLHFSFPTCGANDIVKPVHVTAMPVILADETGWNAWLEGDVGAALYPPPPAGDDSAALRSRGAYEPFPGFCA
jgi:putative SOS response-associated peptidase YedK